MAITLSNSITADRFEHVSQKNVDKTPVRARRNGKTKTWKTRPNLFKIPVKYGLRTYFYIQNFNDSNQPTNADEWNAAE
jgi:hypothetical protein